MWRLAVDNVWRYGEGGDATSTASPWQDESDAYLGDYASAGAATTETLWNTGSYGEGDYDYAKELAKSSTAAPWSLNSDLASDLASGLAEDWRKTVGDGALGLSNDVMGTKSYWENYLNKPVDPPLETWSKDTDRIFNSMMDDALKNSPFDDTKALMSKSPWLSDLLKPIPGWDSPSPSPLDDMKSTPWDTTSPLDDMKSTPWDTTSPLYDSGPWSDDRTDFASETALSDFADDTSPVSIVMKTFTFYMMPGDDEHSMWRCAGVALGLVLATLLVMALVWRLVRCCCCPKPKHVVTVPTVDPERGYDASSTSTGGYNWAVKQPGCQMIDPRLLDLYTKPGYDEKDPRHLDSV